MASTESSFLQIKQHIPEIEAHTLFEIGNFPVKDSFLMILLLTFVFVGLVFVVARFKLIPGRFQSFCEYIYESILNLMTQVIGSEKRARLALPIVGSIMIYIGVANLIPLIPIISALKYDDYHLLRPATADFNTTFGLALAVILSTQLIGIKEWGFFKFISRYFPIQDVYPSFKKGIGAGFESIIHLFVGLLELIGEAAKAISLSMRLFGNIFAHEVLTVVIIGAFAYVLPVVWMGFGILVGVVQAMVFGILVSIYYSMVIKEGDGKTEH